MGPSLGRKAYRETTKQYRETTKQNPQKMTGQSQRIPGYYIYMYGESRTSLHSTSVTREFVAEIILSNLGSHLSAPSPGDDLRSKSAIRFRSQIVRSDSFWGIGRDFSAVARSSSTMMKLAGNITLVKCSPLLS